MKGQQLYSWFVGTCHINVYIFIKFVNDERTLSIHLILMFDHNIWIVLTYCQVSTDRQYSCLKHCPRTLSRWACSKSKKKRWKACWAPAGIGAGLCRAACRPARGSCWPAGRRRPGLVPASSGALAAFEPAQAGLHAGPLGAPAGMPAGPGRAGCRPPRRTWRHASRLRPVHMPGASGL